MPAGLAFLAAAALVAPPEGGEPAAFPPLVSYELLESSRSVTPAGERTVSAGGTVAVRGSVARWDLAHGTFPRSSASSVVAGADGVTLLDRKEKLAARATPADFVALFQGRPSDPGAAAVAVRDVSVALRPDGAGRSFQDRPTSRFRLEAAWSVVLSTPGRITRVKTEAAGIVEAAELPEAVSPLDSLGRLLPARGSAREALEAELAKAAGFPVFVEITITSTSSAEAPGIPSGTEPPPRPVTARSTVTRRVRNLTVRSGVEGDEALVAVPDDFLTRGLDRLLFASEVR
ncbi:MAG TPA: hypothetical protein VFZ57_08515, partial [Thermoanaerobaculia bacterium]|nr:hypothetical protein [Thermoanaerobaculia bacterium]